jgi:hypothetical protein
MGYTCWPRGTSYSFSDPLTYKTIQTHKDLSKKMFKKSPNKFGSSTRAGASQPLYKFWEILNIWIKVSGRMYVRALKECGWSNFKFKFSRWFISAAESRADCAPLRPCALVSAKQVRVLARLAELGQCSPSAGQTGMQRGMSVYVSWRFKASHFYLAVFKAIYWDAWILVVAIWR